MQMDESGPTRQMWVAVFSFLSLIFAKIVKGDIEYDKHVLLNFKSRVILQQPWIADQFTKWKSTDKLPCNWSGISCDQGGNHVTAIDLSNYHIISPELFGNFSALPELRSLNLTENNIYNLNFLELGKFQNLRALNLSNNHIECGFNLTGLDNLEVLDLSVNGISCRSGTLFSKLSCKNLVVLNLSGNNLTESLGDLLNSCNKLRNLDLSSNNLSGSLPPSFDRLDEFSVSGNSFGVLSGSDFSVNCRVRTLDLSENLFMGDVPKNISNCRDLVILNLSKNKFDGKIPSQLGFLTSLQSLLLSDNNLSRDVPESLVEITSLTLLDLSNNGFGGDIQEVFGQLKQVKHLLLNGNSYSGGLSSSGIYKLRSISRLDLSENKFFGTLPIEISEMSSLQILVLANNSFTGNIPHDYGNLGNLQILDLSYNKLDGSIPQSFGRLSSLLWLMLRNNLLTGEIPEELGNCSSLLWLNLANNQLSGTIPAQVFNIGQNSTHVFLSNQIDPISIDSGSCKTLVRWIPADNLFPSDRISTKRGCEQLWNLLVKVDASFPIGYIQLSGNAFSGELFPEIRRMKIFGMIYLDDNRFYGKLPPEIGSLQLLVLDISKNRFSGEIKVIGKLKTLEILDLSYNFFSGEFPKSMADLTLLAKFNISYNPYISGKLPGQFGTFDISSYLGNPLLIGTPLVIDPFSTEEGGRKRKRIPTPEKDEGEGVMDGMVGDFLIMFVVSYPVFFVASFLFSLHKSKQISMMIKRRWGNHQHNIKKEGTGPRMSVLTYGRN